MLEDKDDGIGAQQKKLISLLSIDHDVHSVKIRGIRPMPSQNASSHLTLQRCKPKDTARITPQNELHQPVAQTTYAIVEKNRMRGAVRR
jgi:hypothetical protein